MANMDKKFDLFALENPILDIQAQGDKELLEEYGLKADASVLAEEHQLGIFDKLMARDASVNAGGAAQNSARGAQYILPPNSVVYVGCVGKDADTLREANKKVGLHVEYLVDPEQPTGRCAVVITDHYRSMVTQLGAANCYKLEHLQSKPIWSLVEAAKVFYVGGYHLAVCPDAVMALAREAASKNKIFVLSIAADYVAKVFADRLAETAPYWDYVIGNEVEALAWAEKQGIVAGPDDMSAIAEAMVKLPKANAKRQRVAVVTQGTHPTVVAVVDESGNVTSKKYPVHALEKSEIRDTTGAGDAFAGGFLAGIVAGKDLDTCVNMGQWLAKLSLSERGPAYPFPKQTYPGPSA